MKRVITLADLRSAREALPNPLGLVPTMGFLHEGHLSLVRSAQAANKSVAVSIFVNPTQFGPHEDLEAYPRDLELDLALLAKVGVDLVWTPSETDMYPPGYQTWVELEGLTQPLEGAHRPGHFRGVTTVVAKLLNAVQPQRAYFGQKDAQQAAVIRKMVMDLNMPVEVVVSPIVREPDGLALSSRNTYLSGVERQAATVLYKALTTANLAFDSGERDANIMRTIMQAVIAAEPLAHVQYISVADPQTLIEQEGKIDQALLSMAVYIGKTRLIDNLLLGVREAV